MTLALLLALLAAPEIRLPEKKGAIVLRLSEAGLVSEPVPVIDVLSDGTVRVGGKAAGARLTKPELMALLRWVVVEQRFFEYDAAAIEKTIAGRRGGMMCGTGVTVTGVMVHVQGMQATMRKALLESDAADHADLAPLVRLRDVARRLRLEARLAQAGGRRKVEGWLKRANARLKQRHPKEAPLRIEHFRKLDDVPKGEIALRPQDDPNLRDLDGECAVFTRIEGTPQSNVSASVRTDPKHPVVAVSVQG